MIFLALLLLERFFVYFNAPPFKGFGILDTVYLPGISSRYAFGLSLDFLGSWMLIILYFLAEESSSHESDSPIKYWRQGLFAGVFLNIILFLIQGFTKHSVIPFTPMVGDSYSVSGFFVGYRFSQLVFPSFNRVFLLLSSFQKLAFPHEDRFDLRACPSFFHFRKTFQRRFLDFISCPFDIRIFRHSFF